MPRLGTSIAQWIAAIAPEQDLGPALESTRQLFCAGACALAERQEELWRFTSTGPAAHALETAWSAQAPPALAQPRPHPRLFAEALDAKAQTYLLAWDIAVESEIADVCLAAARAAFDARGRALQDSKDQHVHWAALEAFPCATALVDRDLSLRLVNQRASELLARADCVEARQGRLCCARADDDAALSRAITCALALVPRGDAPPIARLARCGLGRPYVAAALATPLAHLCLVLFIDAEDSEHNLWRAALDLGAGEFARAQAILAEPGDV